MRAWAIWISDGSEVQSDPATVVLFSPQAFAAPDADMWTHGHNPEQELLVKMLEG